MSKLISVDKAISAIDSIISKNRHSFTDKELRDLFEVVTLLKEYKDKSSFGSYLNPIIIQKATEVLLRFMLEADFFDKLNDLFS